MCRTYPVRVDYRQAESREVAFDDFASKVDLEPGFNEFGCELSGYGPLAHGAGVDFKQG